MAEKTYLVLVGKEQKGPVDESWICVRLTSGELSPRTLVWSEGMAAWAPAESLEQFQGLGATAPPPPTPPPAPARTAPPPIPPVSPPPAAVDDDDRTVTVGHAPPSRRSDALAPGAAGPHSPRAERSVSDAEQRPGRSIAPMRSVSMDARTRDKGGPDPHRKGWNRGERIVAASVAGAALVLATLLLVPWFKKRVLGSCDEVYDDCVATCDRMFDTYADMQQCVGPCEDDRRQCLAREQPMLRGGED